jgi:hypothetical protein
MNNDTHLDVVSANWLDSSLVVMLGNGAGALVKSADVSAVIPKSLDLGDVDGDGALDVATSGGQYDVLQVFRGDGSGGLLAPKSFSTAGAPASVMLSDVSGDGRPDLISANHATPSLTVFVNTGDGNFGFAHASNIIESLTHAVAGDMDSDGFADVVTSNQLQDSIRVHMCSGVGSWQRYCEAKQNSLGCIPVIQAQGTPSVSNPRPFTIRVDNVLNSKAGLFLYTVNGAQAQVPFQGGLLCVGPTSIRRTPGLTSGGYPPPVYDCSGWFAIEFNAFAAGLKGGNPDPALLVLGNRYQVQAWGRDPGFAAPNNTTLSDALDVEPWH